MLAISEIYRPNQVKILFVAEAPGGGEKHFYHGNTNLYRTIRGAFEIVYGNFNSPEDFIKFFKSIGCFLDHLSQAPLDKTNRQARLEGRKSAVASLSSRINEMNPEIVVVLMREITPFVESALGQSNIRSVQSLLVVPYPAGSHANKQNCISEITQILKQYGPESDFA
ncbi:hypothetical protein [Dyadobacter luticola]|uniref:Uracil-DNA glycosylase-like domain-containing protein n=1 Tax=Dyadobacter luticola TaxID=1979387 RepID=A0A5R9KZ29_9BACT|nr:hypothetical protein [Dyadobacter luticola]TLV01359.1 hypothetical protein FEN17_18165 [Dyadobacter luticola]